ncbi:Hypothetical predicted protein, partial [Marmota monax]
MGTWPQEWLNEAPALGSGIQLFKPSTFQSHLQASVLSPTRFLKGWQKEVEEHSQEQNTAPGRSQVTIAPVCALCHNAVAEHHLALAHQ